MRVEMFFKRVKRVLDYAPLLWNDEDDGCDDFIKLIVFKAKRMRKCISTSPNDSIDRDILLSSLTTFIRALEDYQNPSVFKNLSKNIVGKLSANDLRELNIREEEEMDANWEKAISTLLIYGQTWYN